MYSLLDKEIRERKYMPAHKAKKKAASRTMAAPRARKASVHPLHKHYFMEEQEAFFRKHPLAQMLLTIFLLSVVMFFVTVYVFMYR
jgi:hypothetical protein